jgi:hypothetical protein
MKDRLHSILLVIAILLMTASWLVLYCSKTEQNIEKVDTVFTTKTDTLWHDTTIVKKEYVPTIVEKIQIDTVYDDNGDTIQLIVEAKKWEDSIVSNKDTAYLQIFTTGIKTSLDSLKMRLRTHTEVVTNTVEVTKYVEKKKTVWDKISIGLQGGYGYGFQYKGFEPYVGVGVAVNL